MPNSISRRVFVLWLRVRAIGGKYLWFVSYIGDVGELISAWFVPFHLDLCSVKHLNGAHIGIAPVHFRWVWILHCSVFTRCLFACCDGISDCLYCLTCIPCTESLGCLMRSCSSAGRCKAQLRRGSSPVGRRSGATPAPTEYCLGYNLPRWAPSSSCSSASATVWDMARAMMISYGWYRHALKQSRHLWVLIWILPRFFELFWSRSYFSGSVLGWSFLMSDNQGSFTLVRTYWSGDPSRKKKRSTSPGSSELRHFCIFRTCSYIYV